MLPPSLRRMSMLVMLVLTLGLLGFAAPVAAQPSAAAGTYRNPLPVSIPGDGIAESCADPSVIYGQENEGLWYMYCTTDPLNDADRDANGNLVFHRIPMFTSPDLVNWTYQGDAFSDVPSWAADSAGLWAPEVDYLNGQYYMYYGVTDTDYAGNGSTDGCPNDNAIGVATAPTPLGPWTDSGDAVVDPRPNGGTPTCNFFWTYDPDVIVAQDGTKYIYYGSYYGGIEVRQLTADGLETTGQATQITIPNRYEGAEVVFRDGYYYLFVSATNCCNGPLTGYSVFVGRSTSPIGPFVDREGVSLLATDVGGTPVLSINGNRWVGPGHNTVFQDFDGQWWTIYHAIDQNDPYFDQPNPFNINKRPALLDAIDWVDGWPTVNGGEWISDTPQQAPAAQPGQKTNHKTKLIKPDVLGKLVTASSDEFNGTALSSQWDWVREESANYSVAGGAFRLDVQRADLYVDNNSASVLVEDAPSGNYVVETRVRINLPADGCCYNYTQAGLVIYGDDDNFIKLTEVSIWETRQIEFAKELSPVPAGYPRYGNTVVGPPGEWTYLRIVKRTQGGQELYTAYTSRDGQQWVRGGTWAHVLGADARIGLVAMGIAAPQDGGPAENATFTAEFDYVRVYQLRSGPR